jgi:hypothetical protein
MQHIRKRPRSPSSSSDELPTNPTPFSRDRTLSPLPHSHSQTDPNELDLDASDPSTTGPARKRRRGLRRGLERMGLDDEMGSNSGWRLPALSEVSARGTEPTIISPSSGNETNDMGFGRNEWPAVEEQAKGVLGADDLSRVVYPARFEVPEEEEKDSSHGLDPGYNSMQDEQDEMMLDPTDSQSSLPDQIRARSKGRNWYEPEPDRIIVTSLSDSDGESTYSNSPSKPWAQSSSGTGDDVIDLDNDVEGGIIDLSQYRPGSDPSADRSFRDNLNPETTRGVYSQPGSKGFLVSPSLLSRLSQLSEKERKQWSQRMGVQGQFRPVPGAGARGRELVLYRQVPGRAGATTGWPLTGDMDMSTGMNGMEEPGRFEEVRDEMGGMDLDNQAVGTMGMDMDDGMDIG